MNGWVGAGKEGESRGWMEWGQAGEGSREGKRENTGGVGKRIREGKQRRGQGRPSVRGRAYETKQRRRSERRAKQRSSG
jgi:hypothetical protein